MIIGKFTKQPAEVLDYDIDFSEFLADGDTLVSVGDPAVPSPLNVVVTPAGLALGPTCELGGVGIKQWLSGGTAGTTYKVTVTATSNAGRIKQVEFVIRVKDE